MIIQHVFIDRESLLCETRRQIFSGLHVYLVLVFNGFLWVSLHLETSFGFSYALTINSPANFEICQKKWQNLFEAGLIY